MQHMFHGSPEAQWFILVETDHIVCKHKLGAIATWYCDKVCMEFDTQYVEQPIYSVGLNLAS